MIDLPIIRFIEAFLAIGVRVSGLMLFAPFLGSPAISARVKAILVLALSVLLYPILEAKIPSLAVSAWPMLVFKELLVGAAIGIAANVVFDAVQMAGQVLSIQMGYSLINILDPQTQVDSTVVAMFHQTIVLLIFLRMNVHMWLLRAMAQSFEFLPPGAFHMNSSFLTEALKAGGSVFELGLQIAAPVLSATLIADIVLGLMGKASPQLPLMMLGPSIKSVLGMVVLIVTLGYWPDLFQRLFLSSMRYADKLLHLA